MPLLSWRSISLLAHKNTAPSRWFFWRIRQKISVVVFLRRYGIQNSGGLLRAPACNDFGQMQPRIVINGVRYLSELRRLCPNLSG